jgi:hypothetical protein
MKTSTLVIIAVTGAVAICVAIVLYNRSKSKQKFFGGPQYSMTQDSQQSCEDVCSRTDYYDACMQSCLEGDSYVGEDFNRFYAGDEVSPYRYETPGK